MKRRISRGAVFVLLWGSIVSVASATTPSKIAPDLKGNNLTGPINVIVQRKAGLLSGVLQVVTKTLEQLPLIGATVEQLDASQLGALSDDPTVAYISPDRSIGASADHYEYAVNAPYAWNLRLNGSGVTVAVIDSGIANVPDIAPPIYHQSFVGSSGDPYGHGTHVAGIIAGNGKSSNGAYVGIAQGLNLVDLQVLDANGASSDSTVITGIAAAIALAPTLHIKVINLSLGRPIQESYKLDPLCQAVEQAWKSGITVVVAAGNMGRLGYSTILSPGNDPYVSPSELCARWIPTPAPTI